MMENRLFYVADEPQRVPMAIVVGGERYDVAFNFKPLQDDAAIGLADDELTSPKIFERHIDSAEGFEDEAGNAFAPADLAELVPVEDQQYAVDGALLGTHLLAAPAANRKLNLRNPPVTSKYKLLAWFNGQEVMTEHVLANESQEVRRVWGSLELRTFPITFGDIQIRSYARGLVTLYDALVESSEGYVGRVPAHHKMIVITAHLRGRREILLGK